MHYVKGRVLTTDREYDLCLLPQRASWRGPQPAE